MYNFYFYLSQQQKSRQNKGNCSVDNGKWRNGVLLSLCQTCKKRTKITIIIYLKDTQRHLNLDKILMSSQLVRIFFAPFLSFLVSRRHQIKVSLVLLTLLLFNLFLIIILSCASKVSNEFQIGRIIEKVCVFL